MCPRCDPGHLGRRSLCMPRLLLSLISVLGLAAGCDASSSGSEGKIDFTPHSCGRIGCDFAAGIGVGGRVGLHIHGAEDVSTAGLDVRSLDTGVLTVTAVPDVAGQPTWELEAISAGTAELEVFDPAPADGGEEQSIDSLEVETLDLSGIGLVSFIGDAVGPDLGGEADESWTINAGAPVSFRVTPFVGDRVPTMGRYTYDVTIDDELRNGLIDPELSEGRLYFSAPAGDWSASWADDGGRTLDVVIHSQ